MSRQSAPEKTDAPVLDKPRVATEQNPRQWRLNFNHPATDRACYPPAAAFGELPLPSDRSAHLKVLITPEVTSKKIKRDVIRRLIELYGESHLGGRGPAYDGRNSLYTAGPFPFESMEFVVKLAENDDRAASSSGSVRKERRLFVGIKLTSKADLYHLRNFLCGRQLDAPQETINVLNLVLREAPSQKYTVVGRSFFDPEFGGKGDLGNGLEYWTVYYQSLRPTQMGLSLNIDVSAREFYEPILVTEFVSKHFGFDFSNLLSDVDRLEIKKALRGLKVEHAHCGYNRQYKVTGISTEPASQLTFINLDDKKKSVVQHYRERYNIVLQHELLPALQTGSDHTNPTYLPMEIVAGQRYSRLSERQVITNLLRATCRRPRERENSIKELRVNEEFGVKVKDELVVVDARIRYHDTGREPREQPRMGKWNMMNKPRTFGSPIRSAQSGQIERALMDIHKQFNWHSNFMIRICFLGLKDYSLFTGKIKRICETELGIVSQCCQPMEASKPHNNQYLANVSLKINVKVGGCNSVLDDAIQRNIPLLTDRPTIGKTSIPSIAAVVASMDWPEVTQYRGIFSSQGHNQEIIQDLYKLVQDPQRGLVHEGMIRELLIAFRRSTGLKPHRITFYRDGVGESQISQVLFYEIDAIRNACLSLEEGYLPPITFVVVLKRHHTRLFPINHNDRDQTDRSGNILPGTVIDTKICHPREFDFYLKSHAGILGSSRPIHYHVLYDENRFTADALQMLTNNLCYTYARCTRSVSIVPPAYYAHLAAFRARYYIEGETSDSGSTNGSESRMEFQALPLIKDNVKDVMFYC
ncbi:hypothetical protein I3842_14G108200 [Carya illinoinensis]|uniref:Uncharacterized protein n=1 Tax=Carya illinoinensis TaxID=32201 RepID=A0A922AJT3_CARIL|nr:hypothetical protein I3842_14G108200 [Carya illinoinensis]